VLYHLKIAFEFSHINTALDLEDDLEREKLAEMISTSWLTTHEEMYYLLESELQRFIPNLEDYVGELSCPQSEEVARTITAKYGISFKSSSNPHRTSRCLHCNNSQLCLLTLQRLTSHEKKSARSPEN
jgi:hypothetical protein